MSLILSGSDGLSDIDGSAATPAIRGTDANTGMFFPAADTIAFAEGGVEVARFNADAQFVVTAGTASLPVITTTGDTNTGIFFPAADTIAFTEGGTESARIDSSGNLLVGTASSLSNNSKIQTVVNSSIGGFSVTQGSGGSPAIEFYNSSNARKGVIYQDITNTRLYAVCNESQGVYLASAGTSWTAASDERLKDIIEPITNAAAKVSSLRAVIGKYKTDEEGTRRAFLIAQDVQAVLPEAVDASNPDALGVQYTDTIPLLVAAIQEQQALITSLTARIAALEGAAQ